MTENDIMQLAKLAQEAQLNVAIDFNMLGIQKDELYQTMAKNVLEQLEAVEEQQRAIVCMATMTKLLVENFALNVKAQT